MNPRTFTMALSCVVAIALEPAAAQENLDLLEIEPKHYTAYRTLGDIDIDGRLDEPSWQRAAWTELFVDIEGDMKPRPRFDTRAKVVWDDEYLYIAADMEEPHVQASLTERDSRIYNDNDFEVFIDPDGDTHEYYEFEINAFSTEWDLFLVRPYRDGGPYMDHWDINGLKTAVQVWGTINDPSDKDQGWSLEMAFPWTVLKENNANRPTPPREGDQWRINFSRVERQWEPELDGQGYLRVEGVREDNWVWSPQGLVNMHVPEQWGFLRFSEEGAGTQTDPGFQVPPEEEAKKVLREIYYRQVDYRQKHGHYTASLDTLGVEHRVLRNFLWPPSLKTTDYLFEAWLEEVVDLHEDGKIHRWVIGQNSRTWKAAAAPAAP